MTPSRVRDVGTSNLPIAGLDPASRSREYGRHSEESIQHFADPALVGLPCIPHACAPIQDHLVAFGTGLGGHGVGDGHRSGARWRVKARPLLGSSRHLHVHQLHLAAAEAFLDSQIQTCQRESRSDGRFGLTHVLRSVCIDEVLVDEVPAGACKRVVSHLVHKVAALTRRVVHGVGRHA